MSKALIDAIAEMREDDALAAHQELLASGRRSAGRSWTTAARR